MILGAPRRLAAAEQGGTRDDAGECEVAPCVVRLNLVETELRVTPGAVDTGAERAARRADARPRRLGAEADFALDVAPGAELDRAVGADRKLGHDPRRRRGADRFSVRLLLRVNLRLRCQEDQHGGADQPAHAPIVAR
jgi:hypothetical protein